MTMLERVAMALEAKIGGSDFTSYEDAARAAIEAMREPTEHMLDIGACYEDPGERYAGDVELGIRGEGDTARDVYVNMIDAALSEEKG